MSDDTADAREALAAVYIRWAYPNYRAWTGGAEPEEALAIDPGFILNAPALRLADAILASGWRPPRGPVTDEMVDAAQQAFHDFVIGPDEPLTARSKGITRQAYRAALEAAEARR